MKRHTSNSASATNGTSSPSGTREKTAVAAGGDEIERGPFAYLLDGDFVPKTQEEAIAHLQEIGILDESGELAEKYRESEPKKRKGRPKKQPPA